MIIEKTVILSNHQIADNIWEMKFESPQISQEYIGAGQFINILPNDDWGHPLRRPMSISSCLLYTSPSPRDATLSRMPSSA